MESKIVWQYGSSHPDSGNYLDEIRQWWADLDDREISWQQRILPPSGDVGELDWEPQRFDEVFAIQAPEIRGIALYWSKSDADEQRNITAGKLDLDLLHSALYIYPKSQPQVVLRVKPQQVTYRTLELHEPNIAYFANGDRSQLIFRDELREIEVRVDLTSEAIDRLKNQIP
ncbi:hypothetical protein IQ235_14560 [Oscillatoriales cyanobacterium LEGE 11467]|uniref:Uncharacterized protein n=1 Tax=Zarconia navalis LEGE 11467 TaxID=1828826 RepID=A0A928W126_9CYAN|nr:hypothetical protein [Zarconia navalis]MBE9042001.1 hypothetical protein [Zarconia navalis LEGE 11467]